MWHHIASVNGAPLKVLPLLLAVAIVLAGQPVPAQETITIRDENMPGRLEAFLIATPKAILNKEVLAILESSGKATFTAIVATDPDTKAKETGVEVQFEEGNLKTVAYLDEDCLKRLEKSLGSLIKTQQYLTDHRSEYSHQDLQEPNVTIAYNQLPGSDERADKAGIMAVGFYGHDEGFGLYFDVFWGRLHHSGQFYFPKASVSDLLKILQSAKPFLVAN